MLLCTLTFLCCYIILLLSEHIIAIFIVLRRAMSMSSYVVMNKAAAMELYGQRRRCTAILQLDRSSAPYRRSDIMELVSRVVDRAKVEAIGQLNNSVWEVVFRDEATKELFVGMELEVKGKRAAVTELQKLTRRVRILHVPTCVPNEFLTSKLGDYGVKVKQIGNDYDRHDGLMSNVRVAVVECRDVNRIPDTLPWIFEGMTGRALVFVQGRPPRCHRCGDRSHKLAQCTAARSYASAAREEADDELEMDDQETEESTSVTAPQQPTVGESAGQVAATSSEGATAEATATATAEVDVGASSMSEGEASDDNDGDEDTSATETEGASATASWAEASAAEFKQPRYAIRRQKRTSKRAAMSASDTNEMPKKIKAPTTTAVKDVEGSVSAAPSTPSTPKDGDDGDPTVRSHSKTRIPTSRRRTQDRDAATSQQ